MAEESDTPLHTLHSLELRLLRCTLPSNHPSASSLPSKMSTYIHTLIDEVIQLIESGQYLQALSSNATKAVFDFNPASHFTVSAESAQFFYSEFVPNCVETFLNSGCDAVEKCYRAFLVVAIAVAAFLAFSQCNATGPWVKMPAIPLTALAFAKKEGSGSGSDSWVEWDIWAQKDIISAGSDLQGKFYNVQYIVFAKVLLMRARDLLIDETISSRNGVRSISWWLSRLLLFQQRLLDGRSSSLFDLLQVFMHEALGHFGTLESVINYWGPKLSEEDALTIVSMLHLEAGIMDLMYGRVDSTGHHLESAQVASRLDFSVSGTLGFRTIHQVEPRAQLILVTGKSDCEDCGSVGHGIECDNSSIGDGASLRHPPETNEASDVLMAPRILEDRGTSSSAEANRISNKLKPIQQAVVLAKCIAIEKSCRNDELQQYKMGPYIEAIDSQESSHFMIQHFCNILRIRWESTRSRTKQRALLMMDKLVESINEPSPGVAERVFFSFGVNSPTIPALRKEFGDLLVSCGLIGEAIKVYEDLELWDNLIYCYRLLEKKAAAVDLIKMQLHERPNDPRLWCSLGDVTIDDSCYEKALEVSGNRSARALRSLARSEYNRGEFEKSKVLWESAMTMNSLYPDGWFALGAAALKAKDVEKALDGFTHAVQLDPENGEAWNNIACLHMVKKKNKEAFVAFKEALKFKRNSWQMWENYSLVAADVGNYSQAIEAMHKVLDMTNNKRIDADLLERLMVEIEKLASVTNVNHVDGSASSDEDPARNWEFENLMQLIGKILRQIVQSGGGADIWGLYARWHKLKGDLTMCSEALLKQVRAYQGSDLWNDRERFIKFARASLELCKVYQEISCQSGSRRELLASEMHLKNIMKQAANFSDTPEYQDLLETLGKVQKALQVNPSAPA